MTSYTDEQVLELATETDMGPSQAAVKYKIVSAVLRSILADRTRLQAKLEACIGVLEHVEFALLGGRRCPLCLGWTDENGESDHHHTDDCQLAKCIDSARIKKGDV